MLWICNFIKFWIYSCVQFFYRSWRSVICNISLVEKDRFLFPIKSKKPKSRSSTAASWLLVPLCPRPSFLPLCLSTTLAAHPSIVLLPPILSQNPFSFSLGISPALSPPQTLPCLYCFLRPQARYSLRSRKKR